LIRAQAPQLPGDSIAQRRVPKAKESKATSHKSQDIFIYNIAIVKDCNNNRRGYLSTNQHFCQKRVAGSSEFSYLCALLHTMKKLYIAVNPKQNLL
jgi:hypothetical protein